MDDDTDSVDRPAHKESEIEVTPEMIAAGVSEFFNYDRDFSNENDVVRSIFIAMTLSRRISR